MSNARPHSLHRPGGAVFSFHESELAVHSLHSLIRMTFLNLGNDVERTGVMLAHATHEDVANHRG